MNKVMLSTIIFALLSIMCSAQEVVFKQELSYDTLLMGNVLEIKYSIDKIKGQLTLIIIAHRLSTIENVDRIFVLSLGSIVEEGSYKSLLKNKESYFYSMAKKQGLV